MARSFRRPTSSALDNNAAFLETIVKNVAPTLGWMTLESARDTIVTREGLVPGDVELCAEIWVRSIESRDGTVDAEGMAQRVRAAFGNPIVRFAVATSPRTGFAMVESGRADPTEALLHFLAVHPEGVGRGVGTALLADAVSHSKLREFQTLTLEVRTNNVRAIELYTRTGFVPFGTEIPHPLAGYPMQSYRLALEEDVALRGPAIMVP